MLIGWRLIIVCGAQRSMAWRAKHYRKRGSASYIVREVHSVRERERQREREREIDGSDVIIVALKLAMSLHFPMPNFRTIAVSSHFPLPKNRTFRFSLHTSCLTIVALNHTVYVCTIGSAEALPILCVRYVRWEREIQREREREIL